MVKIVSFYTATLFLILLMVFGSCSVNEGSDNQDEDVPIPTCASSNAVPGFCKVTLQYDSFQNGDPIGRSYYLFVPSNYDDSTPIPLVFAIHGYWANPLMFKEKTQWNAVAETNGFAVVYPEGYNKSWNATHCCGDALTNNLDDLGLMLAIVQDISSKVSINSNRIYATGHSNGGYISNLLACKHYDVFAAIAPSSAVNPLANPDYHALSECAPTRGIAVNSYIGLQDTFIYEPGKADNGYDICQILPELCDSRPLVGFWNDFKNWGRINAVADTGTWDTTQPTTEPDTKCYSFLDGKDSTEMRWCEMDAAHGDLYTEARDLGFDIAHHSWEFLSRFTLN